MKTRYADRADFLCIYIKEAHPTDEWQMDVNESEDVCYPQPKTIADRRKIARDFVLRKKVTLPLGVDDMANTVEAAYAAWPERLYIVGADGRISYKGDMGPFGFRIEEVLGRLDALPPAPAK